MGNEVLPVKKLRKRLAVAVRSVQWSYAIFWSLSKTEQGALEWHEGYYNGDIKTRKTVQAAELKADKAGLQRSELLRELYVSLSEDESMDQQANTASSLSSSLTPEDLSDAEWYYLVCMSFVFKPGQCLPGRALRKKGTVWLCNAQFADSKVFSRSLLAKGASIQTVVCFPYLGGVVEIGVTDQVSEDFNLLQHIKASLLDFSKPVCTEKSSQPTLRDDEKDDDKDQIHTIICNETVPSPEIENLCSDLPTEIRLDQSGNDDLIINGSYSIDSPDECSKECDHDHQTEDSFMLEGFSNSSDAEVPSWDFTNGDLNSGVKESLNTSGCVSELGKSNHTKQGSFEPGNDEDLHYKRTVSAILVGSSQLTENHRSCKNDRNSSFMAWKSGCHDDHRVQMQQKILKNILLAVPLMYGDSALKSPEDLDNAEDENFLALRSIVPPIHKNDKEEVLNDTITYLKKLNARVDELESCSGSLDRESRARKKSLEILEQTSDNCDGEKTRRTLVLKRKACDIDENDAVPHDDGLSRELRVRISGQEVVIDMKCPYKEYILLDVMDALNNLHLDSHSVQSATLDGVFTLALKSKFRGTAVAPVGMIKQAIWKVAGKC